MKEESESLKAASVGERLSFDANDACMAYLMRQSPLELFRYSLTTPKNNRRVSAFIQTLPSRSIGCSKVGNRTGALKLIPVEILEAIVLHLPMHDRLAFGATSRTHRVVTSRALLTAGAQCLRPYNLTLTDLRFLQSCTKTCVSGIVLKRMFHFGGDCRWPPLHAKAPTPVTPETLDFYCARYEGLQVTAFLSLAAGYERGPYIGNPVSDDAIRMAYTLTKPNAPSIHVFESRSINPLDAILHLPTTADICAWMLDRMWHAYPRATFEGSAMTTPHRLPMHTKSQRQAAWDVIQTNLQNGYWIDPQWSRSHKCLSDPSCPSSWRNSCDRGCLTLKFPTLPSTASISEFLCETFEDVSWNLETITTCNKVWLTYRQLEPRSFKQDQCEDQYNILRVISPHTRSRKMDGQRVYYNEDRGASRIARFDPQNYIWQRCTE
ncbi:hypothetical protein DFH06DRAFT_1151821 [Mycena polygramma]|nr:hypothetical protein DFH06DRAFT_1151821 [Mycena polygramma]